MCHCIVGSNHSGLSRPSPWVSGDGVVAHPDAPLGGGGPGRFRTTPLAPNGASDGWPHPAAPAARTLDPIELQQFAQQLQAQVNPPPVVTQSSTETIRGMTVTVLPDETGVEGIEGAVTNADPQINVQVTFSTNADGRITQFTRTVTCTVTIQTRYGTGNPGDLSAYGRGTTTADVHDGNVTLGFHESRHRRDYLRYMRDTPVPQFGGARGMTQAEFEQAVADYNAAWDSYFTDMSARSEANTDEVGNPTRSAWCSAHPDRCS